MAKTRVKRRTLAPEWGEIFIFEATHPLPKFATLEVRAVGRKWVEIRKGGFVL